MNQLLKTAKLFSLGVILAQATLVSAKSATVNVSCTEMKPAGMLGNRMSLSGNLIVSAKGASKGILTLTLGGSSRPRSAKIAVSGLTMNSDSQGIGDPDEPVLMQLVSVDSEANKKALKVFSTDSMVLTVVAGNANGELDAEADGQSLLALATTEQISENKSSDTSMKCTVEIK